MRLLESFLWGKKKDEYKDFQLEEQKQVVSQNPITPDVKYRENQSELESA